MVGGLGKSLLVGMGLGSISQTCPVCGGAVFDEVDVQEDILANQVPVIRYYCPNCGWYYYVAV